MFRHILVPLDGSACAEHVLPVAAKLARISQGTLTLLRVVDLTHHGLSYGIATPYIAECILEDDLSIAWGSPFLWVAPDEQTKATQQQTLVAFRLTEDGAQTKLSLTESGFEKLAMTAEQKATLIANHTPGWGEFLSGLQRCAQNIPTEA